MKVLLLGAHAKVFADDFGGAQILHSDSPESTRRYLLEDPDWTISFGYKHIIPRELLSTHKGYILNVHISLLPWNRGMHPNFWSWLENTPKGVSIHLIDEGIDTGPLLGQKEILLDSGMTLRETYDELQNHAKQLFRSLWPDFREGNVRSFPQKDFAGSFHRASDLERFMGAFPDGWDTECSLVREFGRRVGAWIMQ